MPHAEIKSRPHPPTMDRRWLVKRVYRPSLSDTEDIYKAVEIIDNAGLVAEIVRTGDTVYLYAARRQKNNGRVED